MFFEQLVSNRAPSISAYKIKLLYYPISKGVSHLSCEDILHLSATNLYPVLIESRSTPDLSNSL